MAWGRANRPGEPWVGRVFDPPGQVTDLAYWIEGGAGILNPPVRAFGRETWTAVSAR
jgi:hypothetical protein